MQMTDVLRRSSRPLFGVLLLLASSPTGFTADWPQWRGPTRDGQAPGQSWPNSISETNLNQLWRIDLGPSYSGPIVSGNLVFSTETVDKNSEVVRAFDRQTGRPIWHRQWDGAMSVPFFARRNGSWIRATPACDGERLYVAGMRDLLVCLDARTGEERWRFDFVRELQTPLPSFGFVCSPLVDQEAVYVQAGAAFAKLDKRTGKLIWRSLADEGGMGGSAFSSPVFAELGGQRQLVVQTREQLAGVNPSDGGILWTQPVKAFRGMNILTPVVFGDSIFTSTYGGKTILFKISRQEDTFEVAPGWTHKYQGYMSTPVVVDGVAYHHLKSQRVTAFDLKTGTECWTTSRSFGKYWSLVAQGDRILGLDQRGWLYLLKATPKEFTLLDQRRLTKADTWAHLAVAGNQIFVRELKALVAYRWEKTTRLASAARP